MEKHLTFSAESALEQITKAIPYTSDTETLGAYDTAKYADLLIRAAESILLRQVDELEVATDMLVGFAIDTSSLESI